MAPMTASRRLTPGTRPARLARRPAHTSGSVMLSGSSCVSKSMNVSAISDQSSRHAATAMSVGPKRKTAAAVTAPVSSSTSGYRAEIDAWQAEQRPRRKRKLTTGMFSSAEIRWTQAGHCERGTIRLYRGRSAAGSPESSAHCARQPRSSIFGRRWMTTFRKLPMHSPINPAMDTATSGATAITGIPANAIASDNGAELEDRQIHGDHQAADHNAQEHDDDGLQQARQRGHRVVDLALEEVGDLGQHAVERARFLADLRHLQHHRWEEPRVVHRVGQARAGADLGLDLARAGGEYGVA